MRRICGDTRVRGLKTQEWHEVLISLSLDPWWPQLCDIMLSDSTRAVLVESEHANLSIRMSDRDTMLCSQRD